ncbi:MAG: hypothetical protein Q9M91_01160 [Candidatus Dojkabacteria bacterium]|nr:hypothetical protein [Candidatus Dojkabacteria bacterium]
MQSKKFKNSAKGNTKSKEWWFKPKIEAFDIKIKLNKIKKFLSKGGVAKITVRSQRRVHKSEMYSTMDKVLEYGEEFFEKLGDVSSEGRNLSVLVKLKSNSKNEETEKNQTKDS